MAAAKKKKTAKARSLVTMIQRSRAQANAALACVLVGGEFNLDAEAVLAFSGQGRKKSSGEHYPQYIAIYLCCIEMRCSQRSVAEAFGCSHRMVGLAVQEVEELREGAELDETIERLARRICPSGGGTPVRAITAAA